MRRAPARTLTSGAAGDLRRDVAHGHGHGRRRRARQLVRHGDPDRAAPVVRPGVAQREGAALALAAGRQRQRLVAGAGVVVHGRRPESRRPRRRTRRRATSARPRARSPSPAGSRRRRRAAARASRRPRSRRRSRRPSECSASSSQRESGAPLTYQSVPLSATIIPYFLSPCRIVCTTGGKPLMSKSARSRTRSPIGGRSGSVRVAGEVRRRIDVGALRVRHGEAQRVVEHALVDDLVVAGEAGQDRQAGRVGGGPAVRPQGVARQVEDRAGAGLPGAVGLLVRVEQLVELLVVGVEHQHVAVAVGVRPPAPSTARSAGSGTDPGRSRRRSENEIGTLGCVPGTTT